MPINIKTDKEVDIINSMKQNTLYSHEFEKGRFFQVCHYDQDGFEIKLASKTNLKVVFLKDKNDIEGFEITKIINGVNKNGVKLSKFNFKQLKAFLHFISQIDLNSISERKISLQDDSLEKIDENTERKIKTLLKTGDGLKLVKSLLDNGLDNEDLVNTGYRKKSLETFKGLLYTDGYIQTYKAEVMNKPRTKDETAWQYFFEKNEWIFGYGLDYRFIESSNKEVEIGYGNIDFGSFNKFTVLVETKLPETPLIKKAKKKKDEEVSPNRADAWSLSD